jgi:hypothetical protein
MSTIWIVMIALGLLTFGLRLSFVLLLERWQPPVDRHLHPRNPAAGRECCHLADQSALDRRISGYPDRLENQKRAVDYHGWNGDLLGNCLGDYD